MIKTESLRKYLAFSADVATIIGVSFLGVFGNRVLSLAFSQQFSVSDFLIATLFFFALIVLILFASIFMLKKIGSSISQKYWSDAAINTCFLIGIWVVLSFVGGRLKTEIAAAFNNEYLLSPRPVDVVDDISSLAWNPITSEVNGQVKWKSDNVRNDKYCIITYVKYDDESHLEVHRFKKPTKYYGTTSIMTNISKDGTFVIPYVNKRMKRIVEVITLERVAVAVLRKANCERFPDYPHGILSIKDQVLEGIGAYCVELPQSNIQNAYEPEL